MPGQDSGTFDTDANSPVPRNVAASVCRSVCETILSSTAPTYLNTSAPLFFCTGTETTGFGELGGLVVDLDRGFRVDLTAPEAGVVGGSMPFASPMLDMLCDLDCRLRGGIVAFVPDDDAPLMCGDISGS